MAVLYLVIKSNVIQAAQAFSFRSSAHLVHHESKQQQQKPNYT